MLEPCCWACIKHGRDILPHFPGLVRRFNAWCRARGVAAGQVSSLFLERIRTLKARMVRLKTKVETVRASGPCAPWVKGPDPILGRVLTLFLDCLSLFLSQRPSVALARVRGPDLRLGRFPCVRVFLSLSLSLSLSI